MSWRTINGFDTETEKGLGRIRKKWINTMCKEDNEWILTKETFDSNTERDTGKCTCRKQAVEKIKSGFWRRPSLTQTEEGVKKIMNGFWQT